MATRNTSPCKPTAIHPMAMAAGPAMNFKIIPNTVRLVPQAINFSCKSINSPAKIIKITLKIFKFHSKVKNK